VSTVSPAELAHRVRRHGLRIDDRLAESFLHEWRRQGVVEELDGRWRLTKTGRAMFGGWADGIGTEGEERAA
jgi:hypothetical protein